MKLFELFNENDTARIKPKVSVPKHFKPLQKDLTITSPSYKMDAGKQTVIPKGTPVGIDAGGDMWRQKLIRFNAFVNDRFEQFTVDSEKFFAALAKPRAKVAETDMPGDKGPLITVDGIDYELDWGHDHAGNIAEIVVRDLSGNEIGSISLNHNLEQANAYIGHGAEPIDYFEIAEKDPEEIGSWIAAVAEPDVVEGIEDMDMRITSVPRTKANRVKTAGRIVVKKNGRNEYAFDNEKEARLMFGIKNWNRIKKGEGGYKVVWPDEVSESTEDDRYEVSTWFERDRASIVVTDRETGKDVFELWDDDVGQAVEFGYLDPRDWEGSAIEYAKTLGAIKEAIVPNDGDEEYPFIDDETGEVFPAGMASSVSFDNDDDDDEYEKLDYDEFTKGRKLREPNAKDKWTAIGMFGDVAAGGGDPIDYVMSTLGMDMEEIDALAREQGYADANEWAESYMEMESMMRNAGVQKRVNEKAPPGMEDWITDRKEEFKDRYGDRWEEVLYSTAWKQHNAKK